MINDIKFIVGKIVINNVEIGANTIDKVKIVLKTLPIYSLSTFL